MAGEDMLAFVLQKKNWQEDPCSSRGETTKGAKEPWKGDSEDPLSGKTTVSIRI